MAPAPSLQDQVDALDGGVGALDLDGWVLVDVLGSDAEAWLNDLVTANVAALPGDGSVRSLLLGPTGRIRADLVVHRVPGGFLLLQSPGQPRPIEGLLEPYVLSSDVSLRRSAATPPALRPAGSGAWTVSPPGSDGVPVSPEAFESWRIRSGLPRFPVDLDEDSLPAEAGLDEAPIVDREKGCYLGQESVAKVRNRGHPTRVVVGVEASEPLTAGQEVVGGAGPVGMLTSVDTLGGRRLALARIRWEARDMALATGDGASLVRR
jgi:folate-binding protein YgfZ